jgi:hypothetical protein
MLLIERRRRCRAYLKLANAILEENEAMIGPILRSTATDFFYGEHSVAQKAG